MAKTCHVALAMFMVCCAAQVYGASDDVETAWENFKAHHPINTKSQTETSKRKANFVKAHAMIQEHKKNTNATFQMEHNLFSVMDDEEKKRYTGARVPPKSGSRFQISDELDDSMRTLPASLDYRTNKCLSAVKDQGDCGSCWAFSAIAVLEFVQCKKTGTSVLMSEQQLVDCDPYDGGCNGGWYTDAWNYLKNGSAKQSLYTYTAIESTCAYTSSMIGSKVATYTNIASNSPTAMQTALQNYGPLSVAITVVDSFYYYMSGVYTDVACDNLDINHAVTVVGWGTLSGVNYWIVRNSWGTSWGSLGYILIQRGVNKCSIEGYPATVTSVA